MKSKTLNQVFSVNKRLGPGLSSQHPGHAIPFCISHKSAHAETRSCDKKAINSPQCSQPLNPRKQADRTIGSGFTLYEQGASLRAPLALPERTRHTPSHKRNVSDLSVLIQLAACFTLILQIMRVRKLMPKKMRRKKLYTVQLKRSAEVSPASNFSH